MDTPSTAPAGKSLLLQLRPLVVFCGISLLALAVVVAFAARTLIGSFDTIERDETARKAEQVYRAFEADLRQLAISNRDYAEWDEAEEFIRTREPDFLPANFQSDQLIGMHVDVVWIVDGAGNDVYSTFVDGTSKASVTPAPAAMLDELRPFQLRHQSLRERSPAERTIETSRGLAAASAIEIARSDKSGGTGAVLLFARFIENQDIERVKDTSRLPVAMLDLARPADRQSLPPEIRDWIVGAGAAELTRARVADRDTVTGYSLVRDVDGRPAALFVTDAPRDVFALGARVTSYLLGGVVTLFLVFGATSIGLVLRLLKLQRLHFEAHRRAEEQQEENRRNLVKQAQRDALTGLPNRVYLNERLPKLLQKMADSQRLLALVYIDIDHFKNLNDSRGHRSGDELLQVVAKRLRAAVSTHDLVARMGGDEFAVVASLMPDIEAIDRFAGRLLDSVGAEMEIDRTPVKVTASLGISVYPRDGVDLESLSKHADLALYQAKEAGRGCHRFFAADMDERINEQVMVEQALRQAIGTDQLFLEYQPIVDLASGRVVSLEALMRWRHPELGMIPPARFIPIAEKSDLIMAIGEHALRTVLTQQRAWLDDDVPIVPIAVNVSPLQLERLDFAAHVARLAAKIGVEQKWVRFEITESAMMREREKLVGTLRTLRERGSRVLIDDFGTGYSSLSYLDRLPIDIIKIDRAFVRDLRRDNDRSPIVDAVIDIAKRLKLETVAEGVETAEQATMLRERGCNYAQGFFYSKAVSAAHCRSMLEHLRRERPLTETMVLRVIGAK